MTHLAEVLADRAGTVASHTRHQQVIDQLDKHHGWHELIQFVVRLPGDLLPTSRARLFTYDHRAAQFQLAADSNSLYRPAAQTPDHAACNVADPSGTCVTVPAACPEMVLPVCGCDHRTYGNDCQRRAAKMAKESNDSCDATTCPDVIDKVCANKDGKLVTYDNYCVALRDAARRMRMSKGACEDGK
jgi:hypothetical protein